MIYQDEKICTPGFTPLTVTTPPTLDGYVILYQALPNTTQPARWGSSGLQNIIKQSWFHAYILSLSLACFTFRSLTLKKVWEPLGIKKKNLQGAGTTAVVRAPAGECRSTAVRQPASLPAAPRNDCLHHCLSDVAPTEYSFNPTKHLPQMISSGRPCVCPRKAFLQCDADNMFPRREAQRCAA